MFGSSEFWDAFYTSNARSPPAGDDETSFASREWYLTYEDISLILQSSLRSIGVAKEEARVLHFGCGDSLLGIHMEADGFCRNSGCIINVDFSPTAIGVMNDALARSRALRGTKMDVALRDGPTSSSTKDSCEDTVENTTSTSTTAEDGSTHQECSPASLPCTAGFPRNHFVACDFSRDASLDSALSLLLGGGGGGDGDGGGVAGHVDVAVGKGALDAMVCRSDAGVVLPRALASLGNALRAPGVAVFVCAEDRSHALRCATTHAGGPRVWDDVATHRVENTRPLSPLSPSQRYFVHVATKRSR